MNNMATEKNKKNYNGNVIRRINSHKKNNKNKICCNPYRQHYTYTELLRKKYTRTARIITNMNLNFIRLHIYLLPIIKYN